MRRKNDTVRWEYSRHPGLKKGYPRHLVRSYPEGVRRESMKAAYRTGHRLLADHDIFSPTPLFWTDDVRMERFLDSCLGEDVNVLYGRFVRMAGPRVGKWAYWKRFVRYPGDPDCGKPPRFAVDPSGRLVRSARTVPVDRIRDTGIE